MSRNNQLDLETLKERLVYDCDSGDFRWRYTFCPKAIKGRKAGTVNQKGYLIIAINRKLYRAHRLAWLYTYGEWPEKDIDHIDHNKLNNKITNLRCIDNHTNQKNRKKKQDRVLGVSWRARDNRWTASIGYKSKQIWLGQFKKYEDAVNAKRAAEAKYGYHENHGN